MPPPRKVSKRFSAHSPMICACLVFLPSIHAPCATHTVFVVFRVSSEVIHRGPNARPAGYGFVTFKTLEAAEKAVGDLHEKELDGRPVIVQLARPAAEKEKERSERRAKRRATGRRNARAPPGEVTEAEAEGQAENSAPGVVDKAENAVEGAAAAVANAVKPKKRKNVSRHV